MRTRLHTALVLTLGLASTLVAQNFDFGFQTIFPTPLALPPSGTGGGTCNDAASTRTATLFQPVNSCVATARIFINLNHSRAGDLRILLRHCGVEVVLYDRSQVSNCDLAGQYFFDDNAPVTFAAAVNATPGAGVLAPGTYRPSQSLSAFNGLSAQGDWELVICDEVSGNVGVINSATIDITYLTANVSDTGLPVSVPLGGNGFNVCQEGFSSTVVRTVNLNSTGPIGYVALDLGLTHPVAADLLITLEHNNIVRTVFDGCGGTANFAGSYFIGDFQPSLCTAANNNNVAPMGNNIPASGYAPNEAFSAWNNTDMGGPWKLTICDRGASIGSTGQLTNFNIRVVRQCALNLSVSQPNGGASIRVTARNGFPGNTNFNVFTGTQGSYPNGWFYGIDPTLTDILTVLSVPSPSLFLGTLNACGQRNFTLDVALPPGITFYGVALEVNPQGIVVGNSAPISYTTQ